MTSILIPYGTGEGQTAKVAAHVEAVLAERGFDVTTADLAEAAGESAATAGDGSAGVGRAEFDGLAVEDFDAVLVGASVHTGEHQPEVVAFVERNAETLAARPSGFFQVSPTSVLPGRWAREGPMEYVDRLGAATGWQPDRVGLFPGAPRYSQYDRPARWLFGLAALVTGLGTDASRDHEYTDWDDVERFAVAFGEFVESEREPAGPSGAVPGRRRLRAAAVAVLGLGVAAVVYRTVGGRGRAPGGRDRVSPKPSVEAADGESSVDDANGEPSVDDANGEPSVDDANEEPSVEAADGEPSGQETDEPEAAATADGE